MNTSLIQTKVWLPIYKVKSAIYYQSVRKPTAFEALILMLAIQYQQKMSEITLQTICEIFKIEQNFIVNALEVLIDNDVIETVSGSLEDIKVSNLKVTELGRALFYKNTMHSKTKIVEITCHYDPLHQSLVKAQNNWTGHNKDENLSLSKEIFSENLAQIDQLVKHRVQQADEKIFVWKKPNINISKIENEVERTLWRDLPIEIGLDSNANIHLECKGKGEDIAKFSKWLKQAEPELFWDQVIAHVFTKVENDLPKLDWQQVLGVSLPDKEVKLPSAQVSVYLDESPSKIVQGFEIILSQHASAPKLNGKTLTVPMLFKPEVGFQSLHLDQKFESSVVFQGNTEIYHAKQPRKVALKLRIKDLGTWEKLKTSVLQLINIEQLEPLVFARCFLSESQLIDHAPLLTAKQAYGLHDEMIKTHKVGLQNILWKEKIQILETIEDLDYFRKIFPNILLKQTWLSSALIPQILDSAFEKGISSKTEFDLVFEPFIKANKELKSRIHPNLLKQVLAHQKMDISKVAAKDIAALENWLEIYEQINQQNPNLIKGCKKIVQQFIELNLLKQQIEQHFAPKREDDKAVAIFDTSYLMRHSDKLEKIAKEKFVIIPQITLHELDGLKRGNNDEQTESVKQARQAIRIIQRLAREHLEHSHFELSHFINNSNNQNELSADKQILSIALYHRLNSAQLFSLDKNLCNLAKSVNVQTQCL